MGQSRSRAESDPNEIHHSNAEARLLVVNIWPAFLVWVPFDALGKTGAGACLATARLHVVTWITCVSPPKEHPSSLTLLVQVAYFFECLTCDFSVFVPLLWPHSFLSRYIPTSAGKCSSRKGGGYAFLTRPGIAPPSRAEKVWKAFHVPKS